MIYIAPKGTAAGLKCALIANEFESKKVTLPPPPPKWTPPAPSSAQLSVGGL